MLNQQSLYVKDKSSGCKGGDNCCTSSIPCAEWEGDCDSDNDCQKGLVCGHNNCPLKPQGYWAAGDWDSTDDCCYRAREGTLLINYNFLYNRKYIHVLRKLVLIYKCSHFRNWGSYIFIIC